MNIIRLTKCAGSSGSSLFNTAPDSFSHASSNGKLSYFNQDTMATKNLSINGVLLLTIFFFFLSEPFIGP